jgi:putative MATE family efflux protein
MLSIKKFAAGNSLLRFIRLSLSGGHQDLTALNIRKAVILLAIPMILELCLESVFALVDIFFVNRWLGNYAATAVGLTESVITIVYSLAIGISMAATAMVARRTGEKSQEGAAVAAVQSIWLALFVTLLISVPGVIYAGKILGLMAAEKQTIALGAGYTRIMMSGSVVIMLLFLINGIFRGAGDAFMAMKSLWIANICNIILCPVCIKAFGLSGAAIATTAGRTIGVVYQLYHLFKNDTSIHIKRKHFVIDVKVLRSLAGIATPGVLQFLIGSGSWIVLARLVSETGHNGASAGYQTAIRVLMFFILPAWGLSNAATTLVGQHLGAKQPLKAEESVYKTARYSAVFMFGVTLLFVLFSSPIIGFFTKDIAAKAYAIQAMQIVSLGYVFYGMGMVFTNAFNGAGDTITPTLINLFCFWAFQVPLAWLLAKHFAWGPKGVFIAIPAAETLITLISWYTFRLGRWKTVKV